MISTEGILLEEMSWGKNFEAVWNDAYVEKRQEDKGNLKLVRYNMQRYKYN